MTNKGLTHVFNMGFECVSGRLAIVMASLPEAFEQAPCRFAWNLRGGLNCEQCQFICRNPWIRPNLPRNFTAFAGSERPKALIQQAVFKCWCLTSASRPKPFGWPATRLDLAGWRVKAVNASAHPLSSSTLADAEPKVAGKLMALSSAQRTPEK